jgi:hypothetical protein
MTSIGGGELMPMQIFEGTRNLDSERNAAERRLSALAAAVREHEDRIRSSIPPMRPCDDRLYRRLRQVLGSQV